MEMPGSPRHFAMQQVLSKEKLQRETAEAVLRQQGRPQGGPQYTPHAAEGRPLTMGACWYFHLDTCSSNQFPSLFFLALRTSPSATIYPTAPVLARIYL